MYTASRRSIELWQLLEIAIDIKKDVVKVEAVHLVEEYGACPRQLWFVTCIVTFRPDMLRTCGDLDERIVYICRLLGLALARLW